MFKRWLAIITDHRISLYERMFRIVTGTCMVAMVFTMPMGRNGWNLLLLAGSLVAILGIMKLSIQKRRVHAGATAIVTLLLLLFPICFLTAGGFYSGVPEWFVLCFIYVCITLHGRRRLVFFVLCMLETLLCYGLAFYHPELVSKNSLQHSFFDSAFSVVMVGLLVSLLLMFLNRMYEEENALTQQQKKEIEELKIGRAHV